MVPQPEGSSEGLSDWNPVVLEGIGPKDFITCTVRTAMLAPSMFTKVPDHFGTDRNLYD